MPHNITVRFFDPPQLPSGVLRILLLKLDHIGDFFTAISAFRLIRQTFPQAQLTLICLPMIVPLAQATMLFDRVCGFTGMPNSDALGKVPTMDAEDLQARFDELLEGTYFLAADFRHDPADRDWLDQVQCRYRAGFAALTRKALDIVIPTMEWQVRPQELAGGNLPPHAEMRIDLLAHAIVETFKARPSLAEIFPDLEQTQAQDAYQKLATERRLKIGISLGAGSELRQWPLPYWLKLLRQLIQEHNAVIIFCGSEADKQPTQELIAGLSPENCNDLTGIPSLAELPSYFKLMDAYIGCDTGLTHLAAGLGVPTVNIFAGISNVPVWRAKGPKVKTIYAEVVCAPCHLRLKQECPNSNICMTAIIPEIVHAGFQQLIPVKAASVRTE